MSRFLTLATAAALALIGPATASAQARHPRLHQALHELREARSELQKAPHNFGGHRQAAIRDIDAALKQIRLALAAVGDRPGKAARPGKTTRPGKAAQARHKHHPRLHHALHELREARAELRNAPHDFKGHRVRALHDIDAAIRQIELCLRFARA